ncbi:hypothetical protein EMIHUDRAFT_471624 [Emiliania huxleyi CCMP1516]|uniref:Plastid lipid-associated protein/fibrillin conserved domain-containing protein n=2 Tax=Emiliania huxleyi TaxID=2903 RepID=A0A0D3KAG5_EMIH1|nr:hypothetical protein EMIHUDRAFT_471624 [Emiliania huxleyi CCMP1516]EOD32750.1 hypothetical protein EMIHUDRAFT_471624 [Emiliania huxleyi CCMP1516]|eukprot:XP_005785179.1 hypothetical protein EMIHUDRAFT_471624 [Emiliania huxleyi CCMP1516]
MPALTFFAVAATAIRGGIGVRAPALSLRATPAVSMGEADASLMELARRRDFQSFVAQARDEPSSVLQLVKDAGVAGAISYTAVELTFFAVALPVGYVAWHASTGEWLQPLLLLRGDDVEGKARLLGLLLSYVVLLKTLFPVRLGSHPPCQRHALGSTLLLTPYTQRLLGGLTLPSGRGAAARGSLKAEIRSLAASSRGGVLPFDAAQQQRFDAALAELSALNPTPEPARSPLFSGTWECVWTTESELNFAVDKGLLGLPWRRTYQTIDVPRGALTTPSTLTNVIEFEEGGFLRVGSTISPDAERGERFSFSFDSCAVRWRSLELPLPPVGRGWGELLYLDDELRVQRDVRGDLLVATRVG